MHVAVLQHESSIGCIQGRECLRDHGIRCVRHLYVNGRACHVPQLQQAANPLGRFCRIFVVDNFKRAPHANGKASVV